jgi:hypothetical protein
MKEKKLRKKFRNFTAFSAYWYAYYFDDIYKGDRQAKEIILKLSLPFLDRLEKGKFENCMFVAEKSFVKATVKEAILKAESSARNAEDYKRIRDRVMHFFDINSEEVKGVLMSTDEYNDLLARKHLTNKEGD